jgi:hypothetical protein
MKGGSVDATVQQTATVIARRYGVFECDGCVIEIAKKLGKRFVATFERLRTPDGSDVIALVDRGLQISTSGVHVGIRIGDRVFDNLHPEGVVAAEWPGKFMSATGAGLKQESRPIGGFFGKIFLRKKFVRWLLGAAS